MSRDERSESEVASEPIPVLRMAPVVRASWIDAWQALDKSFASALAAEDHEPAQPLAAPWERPC